MQTGAGRTRLKLQLHPYSSRRHIFLHAGFFALFYFASALLDVALIATWPPSSPNWTLAPIKSRGSVFMKASKSVSQKKTPYQRVRIWYKEENIQKHGRNATPWVKRFCCLYKSEINNSFLYRLSTLDSEEVKQFESPTKAGENIIYFLPSVHFKPIDLSRVGRPPRLKAENNFECSTQNLVSMSWDRKKKKKELPNWCLGSYISICNSVFDQGIEERKVNSAKF